MAVTLLVLNRFSTFFSTLDFPVNLHHSVQTPRHLICVATATLPCETSVSENERQSETNAVINDKLQCTVVTYLKFGEIFNNEIKNGLLLSLPVNFFLIGEYLA